MELYNSHTMPLSNDPEVREVQEKKLRGEELTFAEKFKLRGRDHTITKIGDYECKPDHCYRCITEDTLERYKQYGCVKDERRTDFQEFVNNQGIDWYLGGAFPSNRYGFIIIECPADKEYFQPAIDNGCGMSNDINVRHMKSSPQRKPIPLSMITNIFDYKKVMEEEKAKFDELRKVEMQKRQEIREQQLANIIDTNSEQLSSGGMSR